MKRTRMSLFSIITGTTSIIFLSATLAFASAKNEGQISFAPTGQVESKSAGPLIGPPLPPEKVNQAQVGPNDLIDGPQSPQALSRRAEKLIAKRCNSCHHRKSFINDKLTDHFSRAWLTPNQRGKTVLMMHIEGERELMPPPGKSNYPLLNKAEKKLLYDWLELRTGKQSNLRSIDSFENSIPQDRSKEFQLGKGRY